MVNNNPDIFKETPIANSICATAVTEHFSAILEKLAITKEENAYTNIESYIDGT